MAIPDELRQAVENGTAEVWTEQGRVDCTITIVDDQVELDVEVTADAVTIGWGHGPHDIVEIEPVGDRRWKAGSLLGQVPVRKWKPSPQEIKRMQERVPAGVSAWNVIRSKAGWFHRVRFRREGPRLVYRGTESIDIPVSSAQMAARCYWCGKPSTSREHVPPRVFFADTDGTSGITVPSCAFHNERFAELDTAFFVTIAIMASADHLPQTSLSRSAAKRAIQETKRSSTIRRMVLKSEPRMALFEGRMSGIANIDRVTVDTGVEKIARGLYRHHYGRPWGTDEVWTNTPQLVDELHPFADSRMLAAFEREAPPWHWERSPEVFRYQGLRAREVLFWRLRFFESVDFVVTNATEDRIQHQKLSDKLGCLGPFGDEWFPIPDVP